MVVTRRLCMLLIAFAALSGCATDPVGELKRIFQTKGDALLKQGIKDYDEGRLPQAAASFQDALNAGLDEPEQVTAHKYLAFIHCVSGRERQCRAHFRTALELDPAFELQPAESGHPMWGPVFRSVKGRR